MALAALAALATPAALAVLLAGIDAQIAYATRAKALTVRMSSRSTYGRLRFGMARTNAPAESPSKPSIC